MSLASVSAYAEEPTVFRLDPVFVSVFRSPDDALVERARELEAQLTQALSDRHLIVELAEVPAFEDYSAEVYLLSCPLAEDAGCAYVIASRGQADWALSGVLSAQADGSLLLNTTIVDVRSSRVVVRFSVPVGDGLGVTYASEVADLVDRLAAEGSAPAASTASDEPVGRTETERRAIAASLGRLESELGELEVRDRDSAVAPPKITAEDIARFQGEEGQPPWVRLGLSANQYRRMRNRGVKPTDWRNMLRGREGRVLFRGWLGGGAGPSAVVVDARWVVDPQIGQVVYRDVFQEVMTGGLASASAEVSLGVLPWLDVGVVGESLGTPLTYTLHAETQGDAREPAPSRTVPAGSFYLGGGFTIAPLPTAMVRPTLSASVGQWWGPGLGRAIDVNSVPAITAPPTPRAGQARIGPGVEVDLSRQVQLLGRVEVHVPISAYQTYRWTEGSGNLEYPGSPGESGGIGAAAKVGIQVGLNPLWGRRTTRRPVSVMDGDDEASIAP
ncbi:MAG: hypothetical protein AB8H79_04450 [Myxococcota bacterium]